MTDAKQVYAQLCANRDKKAALVTANSNYDEQIACLKKAMGDVDAQLEVVRPLAKKIKAYDISPSWAGEKYKQFTGSISSLGDRASDYESALDVVYDTIHDKIRDLENKKAGNNWLISGFNNSINAIEKWAHDMKISGEDLGSDFLDLFQGL